MSPKSLGRMHQRASRDKKPLLLRIKIISPLISLWLIFLFFNRDEWSYLRSYMNASISSSGYFDTLTPATHPLVYRWEDLRQRSLAHGIFYFGPHSHQIQFPPAAKYQPIWSTDQKDLLDDEEVNVETEKNRCRNYNFDFANRTQRRRLFLGVLIADDSMEVLKAVGTEVYNVFHTVSFIESNVTHNLSPRKMRFYDPEKPPTHLYQLYQLFGPKTKVSVDYYSSNSRHSHMHDLFRDFIQREGNSFRWAINGMKPDDIAIVGDSDETFTRDFLRALQICDIPQFRPHQDCRHPKLIASTLVFESTPECLTKGRRWHHPDAILGECVDQIGNDTLHPPTLREWSATHHNYTSNHGLRLSGYGGDRNYDKYHNSNVLDSGHLPYPLWFATDVRMQEGGDMYAKIDGSPTGYHFHNFFTSSQEIHNKYLTYGHASSDASHKPLWELHDDLNLAVNCVKGPNPKASMFNDTSTSLLPIYYLNQNIRNERHELWKKIVQGEMEQWTKSNKNNRNDNTSNSIDGHKVMGDAHNNSRKEDDGHDNPATFGDGDNADVRFNWTIPNALKWENLKQRFLPDHGTFYFGPHSHQLHIPEDVKYDPRWTDDQKALIDDEDIDIESERTRCANYNFDYENRTQRRRLFLGSLLADDSFEVLKAVGTEMYNVFHTVSFVESNVTHNLSPRKMRFYDPEKVSPNLYQLYQFFGPKTKVSVDYYSSHMLGGYDLLRDFIQREGNSFRWAFNGMKPDDVAIVGDTDETFTRDFLRALQICDIPQFRPNQDCRNPKLAASTFVFESTPECLTKERRWYHPDAILGECVDQIGDASLHPRTKRDWPWSNNIKNHTVFHGYRLHGYGRGGNFSLYHADNKFDSDSLQYPLYYATDIRMEGGGLHVKKIDGSPTGYHFHNFFLNANEIHNKYLTYGHASQKANDTPLWELHEDLALGFDCAHGKYERALDFSQLAGSAVPIYFKSDQTRKLRHQIWQKVVNEEEQRWGQSREYNDNDIASQLKNHSFINITAWDSSRSAVLGVATAYPLHVYKNFVSSLRATGYSGHIILGINNPTSALLQMFEEHNVTHFIIDTADKCTYNGTIGHNGKIIDMQISHEWNCPKDYPDYKITWARFLFYRDWLSKCSSCTDGVILTDVRDAIFQSDPFVAAVKLKQQAPLLLFQEHPTMKNTHWLMDIPISSCKNYTVGETSVLCSGSVMGSREGILDYINVMIEEFDYWKTRENCRLNMRGDDQSIHNYLYYTNRFKNAVVIPHRTGPIHVVGYQAAQIAKNVTTENQDTESEGWQNWLSNKHGLIDPKTGLILNLDGYPSPQVHQIDRFGSLMNNWLHHMSVKGWPYNKQSMICTTEGSFDLLVEDALVINLEEIQNFNYSKLKELAHFTAEEYGKYMIAPLGKEHYTLLSFLSQAYGDCRHIVDIRTRYVSSALSLASNLKTPVWSFDLPESTERFHAFQGKTEEEWQTQMHNFGVNITFFNTNLLTVSDNEFRLYMGTWLILLDTHHKPYTTPFEIEFFQRLIVNGFRGVLLLDDIYLNTEMKQWWKELKEGEKNGNFKTYDLTPLGHVTGTGLIDFSGKVKIN